MNVTDIVPKITDAKNLQDLSKLFALPMVMVAYFLQSGPQISWEGSVWFSVPSDLPAHVQLARTLLIFGLKSLWAGLWATAGVFALMTAHAGLEWFRDLKILFIIAALLFATALLGLFGSSRFPTLKELDPFWWYALIVWGFFLVAMNEQFDATIGGRRA